MNVTQISIGRFHHFHLARQLEQKGLLDRIYTGYPRFKLKDETGIPQEKIKTFPWLHAPYMMRGKVGLNHWDWLNKEWVWNATNTLDGFVKSRLKSPTILMALSGSGLLAGTKAQELGGHYICDRGSTHICFQNKILNEEYKRWGFTFPGIDPRIIEKELKEYEQADKITIPSEFVKKTFLDMGVPEHKLIKVVYGARLDRFHKVAEPDKNSFKVLWVGGVSLRKGFMYALKAFQQFTHPNKEFRVIGGIAPEIAQLLVKENLESVTFLGQVKNTDLPNIYSTSHVFVIPSLEEGLAMVQGEALACGCPVIATPNSGSEDLFIDGKEGFVVPIHSPEAICHKMQQLADDQILRNSMSENAVLKVKSIGGWDSYGNDFEKAIKRYY